MKQRRDVPPLVVVVIIAVVLAVVAGVFWWRTRPPSGNIQVSDQEWQRRYQQMLRSSQPYNPPSTSQNR